MIRTSMLCVVACAAGAAQAQTVVAGWVAGGLNNSSTIPAPTTVIDLADGLSGTSLARGAGVNQISNTPFSSRGWTGVDLADAIANNDYVEWTLTVDAGKSLNLSNIEMKYAGASSNSPTMMAVLMSTDNFATFSTVFTDSAVATTDEIADEALSFSGLTGTVSFRTYAWGASSSFGGFAIKPFGANLLQDQRGIILSGEVVPTPASAGLMALGGLIAARRRRG